MKILKTGCQQIHEYKLQTKHKPLKAVHPTDVRMKRYSENMEQIYRISSMLKCDLNKVAKPFY